MDQKNDAAMRRDEALDRLVSLVAAAGPLSAITDKYFSHTRAIALAQGDSQVRYALFMRRRVIAALEAAVRLVEKLVPEAETETFYADGAIVPSEKKLMEVRGPFSKLSEIETILLQKVGIPSVCANNAYEMCRAVPYAAFIDMHARHASGPEMNLLAAYGASVGSAAARAEDGDVRGFVGSSQDLTAALYGGANGVGTMPHSLVGFAGGDVVAALRMLTPVMPEGAAVVALVDYRGLETSDALASARWFYEEASLGDSGRTFAVRLDTHGARFAEGLDYERSVEVVGEWLDVAGEYNIVEKVLGTRVFALDIGNVLVDRVRRILFGTGVSVASIIHTRKTLDAAGYAKAQIVASSGFDPQKCQVVGATRAPVDVIGTGSFLPATLAETYVTADVIAYGGESRVKLGREFLFD